MRLVGTKHTATLVNVYSELKDVIWKDDKPHFLVLEFDEDKSRKVATPFQITRKNVK